MRSTSRVSPTRCATCNLCLSISCSRRAPMCEPKSPCARSRATISLCRASRSSRASSSRLRSAFSSPLRARSSERLRSRSRDLDLDLDLDLDRLRCFRCFLCRLLFLSRRRRRRPSESESSSPSPRSRFSRRSRFLDRPSRPARSEAKNSFRASFASATSSSCSLSANASVAGVASGNSSLKKFVALSAASRLLASAWRTIMDGPRSSFGFPSRVNIARARAPTSGARGVPRLSPSTRARAAESRRDSRARSRRRVYGYYELRCDENKNLIYF